MPHEHWNRLIEHLIFVLAEELNLEIYPTGSTTFKRLNQRVVLNQTPASTSRMQQGSGKREIDSRKIRHPT